MARIQHNNGFYKKMAELQDKLKKSEEERLKLEEKFIIMTKTCREEEEERIRALRIRYEKFLEDDRKRKDRNERIMHTLEKIENRSAALTAKSERLKILRKHYEAYLLRMYPLWKKRSGTVEEPPGPYFLPLPVDTERTTPLLNTPTSLRSSNLYPATLSPVSPYPTLSLPLSKTPLLQESMNHSCLSKPFDEKGALHTSCSPAVEEAVNDYLQKAADLLRVPVSELEGDSEKNDEEKTMPTDLNTSRDLLNVSLSDNSVLQEDSEEKINRGKIVKINKENNEVTDMVDGGYTYQNRNVEEQMLEEKSKITGSVGDILLAQQQPDMKPLNQQPCSEMGNKSIPTHPNENSDNLQGISVNVDKQIESTVVEEITQGPALQNTENIVPSFNENVLYDENEENAEQMKQMEAAGEPQGQYFDMTQEINNAEEQFLPDNQQQLNEHVEEYLEIYDQGHKPVTVESIEQYEPEYSDQQYVDNPEHYDQMYTSTPRQNEDSTEQLEHQYNEQVPETLEQYGVEDLEDKKHFEQNVERSNEMDEQQYIVPDTSNFEHYQLQDSEGNAEQYSEQNAENVEQYSEQNAENVEQYSEQNAENGKQYSEQIAGNVKQYSEQNAGNVEQYSEQNAENVEQYSEQNEGKSSEQYQQLYTEQNAENIEQYESQYTEQNTENIAQYQQQYNEQNAENIEQQLYSEQNLGDVGQNQYSDQNPENSEHYDQIFTQDSGYVEQGDQQYSQQNPDNVYNEQSNQQNVETVEQYEQEQVGDSQQYPNATEGTDGLKQQYAVEEIENTPQYAVEQYNEEQFGNMENGGAQFSEMQLEGSHSALDVEKQLDLGEQLTESADTSVPQALETQEGPSDIPEGHGEQQVNIEVSEAVDEMGPGSLAKPSEVQETTENRQEVLPPHPTGGLEEDSEESSADGLWNRVPHPQSSDIPSVDELAPKTAVVLDDTSESSADSRPPRDTKGTVQKTKSLLGVPHNASGDHSVTSDQDEIEDQLAALVQQPAPSIAPVREETRRGAKAAEEKRTTKLSPKVSPKVPAKTKISKTAKADKTKPAARASAKKSPALIKVLESDSESLNLDTGGGTNVDSDEFDFSTE